MLPNTIKNMVLVSEWYPKSMKFISDYVDSLNKQAEVSESNEEIDFEDDSSSTEYKSASQSKLNNKIPKIKSSSMLVLPSTPPREQYFKNVQNFVNNSKLVLGKVNETQKQIDQVHEILTKLNSIKERPEQKKLLSEQLKNLRSKGGENHLIGDVPNKKFNVKKKKKGQIRKKKLEKSKQRTTNSPDNSATQIKANTKVEQVKANRNFVSTLEVSKRICGGGLDYEKLAASGSCSGQRLKKKTKSKSHSNVEKSSIKKMKKKANGTNKSKSIKS